MAIGILSECQTKENAPLFLRSFRQGIKIIRLDGNPSAVAAELPYTAEKLKTLKRKKQQRLLANALKQLRRAEADQIVCCQNLKELVSGFSLDGPLVTDPVSLPSELIVPAALFAIEKIGPGINSRLKLYDQKLAVATLSFLETLCLKAKYITIYTDCVAQAEQMAEEILEEFGLYINVFGYTEHANQTADILIDADRRLIRVGRDFVINGAELDLDLCGYPVAAGDIMACLGGRVRGYRIKNFLSGKKRLTM